MSVAMFLEIATIGAYLGYYSSGNVARLSAYINEYSDEALKTVEKRMEAATIKNGLPRSVFESVITQARVNITLEAFINDLADDEFSESIATDDISKAISENVLIYLKSSGIKIDDTVNKNANDYVLQCVNIYKNTLIFSHLRIIRQMKTYMFYITVAISIFSITVIAICIILLNKYLARKRQILRYVIYAVGTSWVLIFVPSLLVYCRAIPIYIKGMRLEYQFNLIMNYFYLSLRFLITFSLLMMAIYVILIGAWYYSVSKKNGHF